MESLKLISPLKVAPPDDVNELPEVMASVLPDTLNPPLAVNAFEKLLPMVPEEMQARGWKEMWAALSMDLYSGAGHLLAELVQRARR